MSEKLTDKKGRWRSTTIAFRISPAEAEELNLRVKLSGLTKQDYITNKLMDTDVIIQKNPRVFKALSDEFKTLIEQLKLLQSGGECTDALAEAIVIVCDMYARMRDGDSNKTNLDSDSKEES